MSAYDSLEKLLLAAHAGRRGEAREHERACLQAGVPKQLIKSAMELMRPPTEPLGEALGEDRRIARALRLPQLSVYDDALVPMTAPAIDALGTNFHGSLADAVERLANVRVLPRQLEDLVEDARSFGSAQLEHEDVSVYAYVAGAKVRVLLRARETTASSAGELLDHFSPALMRLHDLIRQARETFHEGERSALLERIDSTTAELLLRLRRGATGHYSTLPPDGGVDATPILRSVVMEANARAKARGVGIRAVVDDDLRVHARAGDVRAIASNLLENALDASTRGGPVKLSAVRDGDTLLLRIEDDGNGMDVVAQEKAFRPGFSTTGGGGLGLPLVRHLVQRLNGSLVVESEVDVGTTMHVTLPRHPATQ